MRIRSESDRRLKSGRKSNSNRHENWNDIRAMAGVRCSWENRDGIDIGCSSIYVEAFPNRIRIVTAMTGCAFIGWLSGEDFDVSGCRMAYPRFLKAKTLQKAT
jgi:hypothetical protein